MRSDRPAPAPDARRAWLASLLLHRHQAMMPRLIAGLARLRALPRGYRRRLQRRAALTAAGAALALAMLGGPLFIPAARAATIDVDDFEVHDAEGDDSEVYTYDFSTGEFAGPIFRAHDAGLHETVDGLQVEG